MNRHQAHSPSAFISYSYDSVEHKDWVRQFAANLSRDGVRVILDAWHLSLGEDPREFTESGIATADFVILICSELYSRKADDLSGNAGGTAPASLLLGHAQIFKKGVARIIPVVRQVDFPRVLPRIAQRHRFIDLSENASEADADYELLVRTLYRTPSHVLPPFAGQPGKTARTEKRIFISYAREDRRVAERIYDSLAVHESLTPWLDCRRLKPGDNWKHQVLVNLDGSDFVLLVLSTHSVSKTGFVQREVREAIERAALRPPGKPFIIPVRADDCRPGHLELRQLHRVDLFPDWSCGMLQLLGLFGVRHYTHYYLVCPEGSFSELVVLAPIDGGEPAAALAAIPVNLASLPPIIADRVPDEVLERNGPVKSIFIRLWSAASCRENSYVRADWNDMDAALFGDFAVRKKRSLEDKRKLVELVLRQWALGREEEPETEEDWKALRLLIQHDRPVQN